MQNLIGSSCRVKWREDLYTSFQTSLAKVTLTSLGNDRRLACSKHARPVLKVHTMLQCQWSTLQHGHLLNSRTTSTKSDQRRELVESPISHAMFLCTNEKFPEIANDFRLYTIEPLTLLSHTTAVLLEVP